MRVYFGPSVLCRVKCCSYCFDDCCVGMLHVAGFKLVVHVGLREIRKDPCRADRNTVLQRI